MTEKRQKACQICGSTEQQNLRRAISVRPAISKLIAGNIGHWDENGWICLEDLHEYQHRYVTMLLEEEKGELGNLDREVLKALEEQELLAKNPDIDFEAGLTGGQRLADTIATFGGSWTFISIFGVFIFIWMGLNTWLLATRPFDPFPFILLNLVLSTLAALQAPVIMMSQNRQESRDRARSVHDYQINLKAELEIRQLHQKIDHILSRQWERMMEIQEIQIELIKELRKEL
ncbi:MAG TPA: DUF1003 domain-containing protein [Chlorobium sp.]|uniref:DUF1003 domain-containing protein n=1 Tax=Chlorobium phaeovibrioides (strain DSM 265 / 1930) TaxID=290318 RepID=A4SG52_CHLPM|nr:DUF1003 domain-containing protein [Chlorobium sp.]